ncbi:tetratricopeptide repeat-containing sensor histidine kinase [Flavihumibacter solisilvae]|uniref:tetratricopeptide repeat-containing sensor histidine kinase n=1 Tax=Flavihumibacter solisilvae TaxID=1349421 RepID=UPI0013649251|nr:histidine kinase [Flavihumibacter solisilvae]
MKRLKGIILAFHFLLGFTGFASGENIDSLKKVLAGLKGSARIDCLNAISTDYFYHATDSAIKFAHRALNEAEKINYKIGIAAAWLNMAWADALAGGNLITMENHCRNAVALLETTGEKRQLAEAWFSLACAQSSQCKFSSSLPAFAAAGRLYSEMGDELSLAKMYNYMGDDERNMGQYSKSLEYAVKWLEIANKYGENSYLDVWASLYMVMGDYETALDYYRQAEIGAAAAQKIGFEMIYYTRRKGEIFLLQEKYDSARYYFKKAIQYPQQPPFYLQWGTLYLALKEYDSALYYLNNAYTHSKAINDLSVLQPALLSLGKIHRETGNTQMALLYARELLQTSELTGARQHSRDGHFLLYQLFSQTGKKYSALSHLQKYTVLKETIDKDLSAQKLAFYKIKAEKEKDQARIDLLNEERKLQKQQLKQTAQQRSFLIIGIAGVLILGIILLRNVMLKRKNEASLREIAENELQLQKLESEKTKVELQHQASELEMQALRAQMNPHFIFNSLNSINRFILQNNKSQASEYLIKFSKLVRMILQNSQAPLITLENELEALELYLDLEAQRCEQHFDYKISVQDDLDIDVLKVPPLIIQPYVENAIWHGLMHKQDKGQLEISVAQESEHLLIKITDDGIGRKQADELANKSSTRHKSVGLKITADRIMLVQQIDAGVSPVTINDLVHSDGSAAGTEVIIEIPVSYF